MYVCFLEGFKSVAQGFFPFCLLLLPPAQTVVQLSMLDSVSGRQRASFSSSFPRVARYVPGPVPGQRERERWWQ